jgi:hypothetical protein
MTTFDKEALAQVLKSLDQTNDALWTDDGSPLVSEVQRLANDKTITRAPINDAIPGFARKTKNFVEEPVEPNEAGFDTVEAKNTTIASDLAQPDVVLDDDDDYADLTPAQEHESIRAIAKQRITDAEEALTDAKTRTVDAYRAERKAEQRLTRAIEVFNAKFPPISAAQNIQMHLAAQQRRLMEQVTGQKVDPRTLINPIDVQLADRSRDNGRNHQRRPNLSLPRGRGF